MEPSLGTSMNETTHVVEEVIDDMIEKDGTDPGIIVGILQDISGHEDEFVSSVTEEIFSGSTSAAADKFENHQQFSAPSLNHTSAIHTLIHKLSERLRGFVGSSSHHEDPGVSEYHHRAVHYIYNHVHPQDGKLLHSDTIILVCSLVIMILLGLILRKVFMVITDIRESRKRYRSGLKQFAEHMQVVTRSISADPNQPPMTPYELRKMRKENLSIIFKESPRLHRKDILSRQASDNIEEEYPDTTPL